MGIIGEDVYSPWLYSSRDFPYRDSWEINMPPTPIFAKIFLRSISEFETNRSISDLYLISLRRRKPDGSDEEIDLAHTGVVWESTLTNLKYGMDVHKSTVFGLLVLEYWR